MKNKKDKNLLEMMCGGEKLSFFQEIELIVTLSSVCSAIPILKPSKLHLPNMKGR